MRISPFGSLRKQGVTQRQGIVKISPNEPCPCGSGVKYKKCCGAAKGLLGWWWRRRASQAKRKQPPR